MIGSPAFYVDAPLRWLSLLALAALLGAQALDALVLPRGHAGLVGARHRLARWGGAAIVLLLATSGATLLARGRTMAGGGLTEAVAALPLVLGRTHFGAAWIARFAALAALVVLGRPRGGRPRTPALALAALVALTTTLTGHAADRGDLSLAVLVDWIHALAGGVWGGGLLGLALVVFADRSGWPPRLFAEVARRFSRLAGWCLLLVVATGLYNAWVEVPALAALWTTGYGRTLALKTALALTLATLGAFNRWVLLPGLEDARACARLVGVVGREALLVVLVFGCTAVLGESTPRRHPQHPTSARAARVAILDTMATSLRALFLDAGNTLVRMDYAVIAAALDREGVATTAGAIERAEWRARVRLDAELFAPAPPGSSTESRATAERYVGYVLDALDVRDPGVRDAIVAWRRAYNPPAGLWNVPEPRAEAALRLARAHGLRVGVVSNSNGSIAGILTALGFGPHLDFVLDSFEVGVEKPDPRIFALALERAGVSPAEAVHVGDLYSVDVRGARAAGLHAVLLDPGGHWGPRDCPTAPDVLAAVELILAGS